MPFNATITENIQIDRTVVGLTATVSGNTVIKVSESVGPAVSGQLTTRTNNTAGTLTMTNANHGINTGDFLDIYWDTENYRTLVTVGTVSGTSVPISGTTALGDVLPVVNTNVTAMVPVSEEFTVTGNNVVCLGVQFDSGQSTGVASFTQSNNAPIVAIAPVDTGYIWYDGNGITNPLNSAAVGKVFVSTKEAVANTTVNAFVAVIHG